MLPSQLVTLRNQQDGQSVSTAARESESADRIDQLSVVFETALPVESNSVWHCHHRRLIHIAGSATITPLLASFAPTSAGLGVRRPNSSGVPTGQAEEDAEERPAAPIRWWQYQIDGYMTSRLYRESESKKGIESEEKTQREENISLQLVWQVNAPQIHVTSASLLSL